MEIGYDIFYIFKRLVHMQIKIEIVFLKKIFFVFFFGRESICLILKKHLSCRSQLQILNMKG